MVYAVVFLVDNIAEFFMMRTTGTTTSLTGVQLTSYDVHDRILSAFTLGLPVVATYLVTLFLFMVLCAVFLVAKNRKTVTKG